MSSRSIDNSNIFNFIVPYLYSRDGTSNIFRKNLSFTILGENMKGERPIFKAP